MPRFASSVGVRRQTKRETAMVSCNILHSGDGVILLVGLRSYDVHLSVIFISGIQPMPNSVLMFVSYGATRTRPHTSHSQ